MAQRVTTLSSRRSSYKCSRTSRERPSSHPFQPRPRFCLSRAWLKSCDHPSTNYLDSEETGLLSSAWPESHAIGLTQTLGQREEWGGPPEETWGSGGGGAVIRRSVCWRDLDCSCPVHRGSVSLWWLSHLPTRSFSTYSLSTLLEGCVCVYMRGGDGGTAVPGQHCNGIEMSVLCSVQ